MCTHTQSIAVGWNGWGTWTRDVYLIIEETCLLWQDTRFQDHYLHFSNSGWLFYNMTRNDLSQAQHFTFRQIILYIPYTLTGQFLKSYATGPVVLWIFPSVQSKHKIGKWKSMIILNVVLTTKLVWVTVPIL